MDHEKGKSGTGSEDDHVWGDDMSSAEGLCEVDRNNLSVYSISELEAGSWDSPRWSRTGQSDILSGDSQGQTNPIKGNG